MLLLRIEIDRFANPEFRVNNLKLFELTLSLCQGSLLRPFLVRSRFLERASSGIAAAVVVAAARIVVGPTVARSVTVAARFSVTLPGLVFVCGSA